MRYQTNDGVFLVGSTPTQVISDLRKHSWFPGKDLEAYIHKTAYFAELQTGKRIRKETATQLLKDLLSVKLLKEIYTH